MPTLGLWDEGSLLGGLLGGVLVGVLLGEVLVGVLVGGVLLGEVRGCRVEEEGREVLRSFFGARMSNEDVFSFILLFEAVFTLSSFFDFVFLPMIESSKLAFLFNVLLWDLDLEW